MIFPTKIDKYVYLYIIYILYIYVYICISISYIRICIYTLYIYINFKAKNNALDAKMVLKTHSLNAYAKMQGTKDEIRVAVRNWLWLVVELSWPDSSL